MFLHLCPSGTFGKNGARIKSVKLFEDFHMFLFYSPSSVKTNGKKKGIDLNKNKTKKRTRTA